MSGLTDESQGHFEGYWGDVGDIFEYMLRRIPQHRVILK